MTDYEYAFYTKIEFIRSTKSSVLAVMYDVKPTFDFSNINLTLQCQSSINGSVFTLKTIIPNSHIEISFQGSQETVIIKTKALLQWAYSEEGQQIISEMTEYRTYL